jgi:hypothetical protein
VGQRETAWWLVSLLWELYLHPWPPAVCGKRHVSQFGETSGTISEWPHSSFHWKFLYLLEVSLMHSVEGAQGFGLLGVSLFYDPVNDGGVAELSIHKIFQLFFEASLHVLD